MRDDCWDDWDDILVLLLGLLVTVLYLLRTKEFDAAMYKSN